MTRVPRPARVYNPATDIYVCKICGALLHPDYLGPHEEWHARTDSE